MKLAELDLLEKRAIETGFFCEGVTNSPPYKGTTRSRLAHSGRRQIGFIYFLNKNK